MPNIGISRVGVNEMNKHVMVVSVAVLFALVAMATLVRSLSGSGMSDDSVARFAQAVAAGDAATVKSMLQAKPDLAQGVEGEEMPLHIAARTNQPELIGVLLSHGAKLDARGQWNGTALHWACWFGSKEAAALLLEKGLEIEDKQDVFGSTPLLWAAHGSEQLRNEKGDYVATVKMLIDRGASADTYNADGVPAVIMASEPVADILRAHGAKVPCPTSRPIQGLVA